MDKGAQVDVLRREHAIAVSKYDFDRAEAIEHQIGRLRVDMTRGLERRQDNLRVLKYDEHRERIRGEHALNDAVFVEHGFGVQREFHMRLKGLQDRHARQLADLGLDHVSALERVASRPVPEAESMLLESRRLAADRRYSQARSVYREGVRARQATVDERRCECDTTFVRAERKLRQRQQREVQMLVAKQEAAVTGLAARRARETVVATNKMRATAARAERERAVERRTETYRPASARRSASVTRTSARSVF